MRVLIRVLNFYVETLSLSFTLRTIEHFETSRHIMSAPKKEKAAPAKDKDPGAGAHGSKADGAKSAGGGMKGKIVIGVFVSLVVIAETFVFFFLVPSGEEVAALAETRLIAIAQEIDSKTQQEHTVDEDTIVEFDLGTHGVSFRPAGADKNYKVEFRLFGTLHSSDLEHMQELFLERELRFRYRMMLEIRNASMQELEENQLGLIQRRVLATSTELLGEAILLSVGFADYQVLED